MTGTSAQETSRFEFLATLLAQDSGNLRLLADAADAAFAEDRFGEARELIERHARLAPLPPRIEHLAGLVAMRFEEWAAAAERFAALLEAGEDVAPVRFNLAWSLAMAKRFDEALTALDEATSDALPQAAQLEVELLHQAGEFDRAAERARALIERHPGHRGLNAAVSTLAIDVEDMELARRTARAAGDHPDALVTLGTLALGDGDPGAAEQLFEVALAARPDAPRALIGRGLVRLLGDDKPGAAAELDRGAEIFGDHLGSWIAAGWAHILAGDLETGKSRFEHALALDDRFAETQGSLAVVAILEGRIEEAKRRAAIASRLDRESFSTALAAMLIAAGEGDPERARKIFESALRAPIDGDNRTFAQALAQFSGAVVRPRSSPRRTT